MTEIGKDTLVVSAEDSKGPPFKITFYETRFEVAALSKEAGPLMGFRAKGRSREGATFHRYRG